MNGCSPPARSTSGARHPDAGFPADGILAQGEMDAAGLVFADIDLGKIGSVRRHGGVLNHRDWPALALPCPVLSLP